VVRRATGQGWVGPLSRPGPQVSYLFANDGRARDDTQMCR
jgi:hypothetical protein